MGSLAVLLEMSRIAEESKACQAPAASDTVVEPSYLLQLLTLRSLASPGKDPTTI
jgi:hypothetical protein